MSAAAEELLVSSIATQRRSPRYCLDVPVEITALRSGIPYLIPGRAINAGQYGLGVALAGDVRVGESVGVQLRLPDISGALFLKAVVRYQSLLLCGLEFQNPPEEELSKLRYWTQTNSAAGREAQLPLFGTEWPTLAPLPVLSLPEPIRPPRRRVPLLRLLWGALTVMLVICGVGWWQWYRTWSQLESQIEARPTPMHQNVPGDVMEKLVTYKVAPVYPEGAKQTQGPVLLDALIAADGSVVDLHPISGPDELAPAAVRAAKSWHFEPYRVNGRPVPVETTLTVSFGKQ